MTPLLSIFGFGDVEILVIGGLAVLFFGRKQVASWYKDIKTATMDWKKDAAKLDAEIKAEAEGKAKEVKATA